MKTGKVTAGVNFMRLMFMLLVAALISSCAGAFPKFSTNHLEQSSVCSPAVESYCAVPTNGADAVEFLSKSSALEPSSYCCKVCSKGKACGDTCISRDKECHKPPGCACNR